MAYPSLEQYQEALQHPATVFVDPELKAGSIATGGLGLPKVMCGGFALTYTVSVNGKRFAVRCFHKQSPDLEKRYSAISTHLKKLGSPYFLPFEFQPQGIRLAGSVYPVVKMAWSTGQTLGDFVADNYRQASAIATLRTSIQTLAAYLETNQIAHGDLQPGNLMVEGKGRAVQLIDYDGMFVPSILMLGAAEIGHRNFQHPRRVGKQFGPTLDRFSAISITVALKAIEQEPKLWDDTQSDSDVFLFRATDFADPGASSLFQKLLKMPAVAAEVRALASISMSGLDQVPSLSDFLAGKNIPATTVTIRTTPAAPVAYQSQYVVLNATDYAGFERHVGDMVELIGKIVEVKDGTTKRGGTYVFINFGPWQGQIVKLSIWPTVLSSLKNRPTAAMVGTWVSVVGLVEPPYVSRRYHYTHISIDISGPNQIKTLTAAEAAFRLGGGGATSATNPERSNRKVLEGLRGGTRTSVKIPSGQMRPRISPVAPSAPPPTKNAEILEKIQRSQGVSRPSVAPSPTQITSPSASGKSAGIPWWVWAIGLLVLFMIFKR